MRSSGSLLEYGRGITYSGCCRCCWIHGTGAKSRYKVCIELDRKMMQASGSAAVRATFVSLVVMSAGQANIQASPECMQSCFPAEFMTRRTSQESAKAGSVNLFMNRNIIISAESPDDLSFPVLIATQRNALVNLSVNYRTEFFGQR